MQEDFLRPIPDPRNLGSREIEPKLGVNYYIPSVFNRILDTAKQYTDIIQKGLDEEYTIDQVETELEDVQRKQEILDRCYNIWASEYRSLNPKEHTEHYSEFRRKVEDPAEYIFDTQRPLVELARALYTHSDLPIFDSVVFIGEKDFFLPIDNTLQERLQAVGRNHPLIIVDSKYDRQERNHIDNSAINILKKITKFSRPPQRNTAANLYGKDVLLRSIENKELSKVINARLTCRILFIGDSLGFSLDADAEYIGILPNGAIGNESYKEGD